MLLHDIPTPVPRPILGLNSFLPRSFPAPASKAAVIFFLPILGSENGKSVSSASVGMADSVRASRVASAPNLYAIPNDCTMPASESLLCGE
jgi:hypothetical protein